MVISKAEYNCLKLMTTDLMNAEYFVNTLGVETRTDKEGDSFRNIKDILKDITFIVSKNPTILEDCEKFLETNPTTSNESQEFLSHYDIEGVFKL